MFYLPGVSIFIGGCQQLHCCFKSRVLITFDFHLQLLEGHISQKPLSNMANGMMVKDYLSH